MALLAAIAWFALILQFYIMLNNSPAPGFTRLMLVTNFFSYFTILSNLLVAVCLTVCSLLPYLLQENFFNGLKCNLPLRFTFLSLAWCITLF